MLDAESDVEIAQQGIGGVEIEPHGGLRRLVVEPEPLDITLLEFGGLALVVPPVGHHEGKVSSSPRRKCCQAMF